MNQTKRRAAVPAVEVPGQLRTPEFLEAWAEWQAYRKALRKPLVSQSASAQLKRFAKVGAAAAVAMIRRSIEAGWLGLFAPGNQGAATRHVRPTAAFDDQAAGKATRDYSGSTAP